MKGHYQYTLDREPAPFRETFELLGAPGAWTGFRSERRVREPELRLSVAGTLVNGVVVALALRRETAQRERRAAFHHSGVPARGPASQVVDAQVLLGGLLRVSMGFTVRGLLARNGSGLVMTPGLDEPLFRPVQSARRVKRRGESIVPGHGQVLELDYAGGAYQPACRCWLASSGLLLRYRWDQPGVGCWDVSLAAD